MSLADGIGWDDVILTGNAAFEGPAHPHKANILKYPGEKVFNVAKDQPERIQPESISTQKVETAPIASP